MYAQIHVAVAAILIMVSAAAFDVRSREVPDSHWVVMAVLGMVNLFLNHGVLYSAVCSSGYILICAYMFSEKVTGIRACTVLSAAACLLISASIASSGYGAIVSLSMTVIILLMYHSGLIRGGADAKALITISMVYPTYPELCSTLWSAMYPAGYILNPVFSILLMSLLLSSLVIIDILYRNAKRGKLGLSSYPMGIEDARHSFVWPTEDAVDGEKVRMRASEDTGAYDRMEASGYGEIMVTPMIPFLFPMAVALSVVVLFGSPVFILFGFSS